MIEISCSKPDCFWKGPANEAADHPCPTPAAVDEGAIADLPQDPTAATPPLLATKAELEHWLAQNGEYDAQGNPGNAETAEADRLYAIHLAAERAPAPEPDLDEPAAEPDLDDDAPWQARVAAAFEARADSRQMKWLIVDEDAGDLLDAHPLKAPAEAAMIEWLHGGREATLWRASDVVKAAAALENLAQPFGDEGPPIAPPGTVPNDPALGEALELTDGIADALDLGREPLSPGDRDAIADSLDDDHAGAAEEIQVPDPDPAGEPITPAAREAVEKLLEPAAALPAQTEQEPAPQAPPAAQTVQPLFDAADYDKPGLQIPKVDGHAIDRIGITFGGGVMLDRSEPNDVGLYNRIHGQQTIELWVEAKWGGTGAKPATNRDGDLDVIVGHKSLRVESIRIVDADALGALEGLELVRAAVRRAHRAGVPDDQIENAAIETLAEQE